MNKDCSNCGSKESIIVMVIDERYEECVVCGEISLIKIEEKKNENKKV